MKHIILPVLALMLAACATQEEGPTKDVDQAIRDFIEVRDLQEVSEIRTNSSDRWNEVTKTFILYSGRSEEYLVEFGRRCFELDQVPVVPDRRKTNNRIYAKFDTIRGCVIAKIYPLNEAEVAELKDIGESPGSRN